MKKNKKWFSLVIAIWLILITTLLAYTILEYMIPFWRSIKWIENSTKAYYLANSWVEKGLYFFSNREWSEILNDHSLDYSPWNHVDFRFNTTSIWTTIPPLWRWNSEYDNDWNKISVWEPIQLSIWYWTFDSSNINNLSIIFRVPEVQTWIRPSMDSNTNFINWQLTSDSSTLNSSSTSVFNWGNIGANINWNQIVLWWSGGNELIWVLLNWFDETFRDFYTSNCSWLNDKCILKFSVINNLVWTYNTTTYNIPFIEWKINSWTINMPLRYSIIDSQWKSSGFVRDLNVRVPQETVSEAFDFTVFQ